MATDKWLEFNGVEIVNLSRTSQLAPALGIDSVWVTEGTTQWIEAARGGDNYEDVTLAPWYDASYPASAEFAGIVPLGFPGLDDSTTESITTEYVTAGGRSGQQRNSTLVIVASVAIIASTERGADYGKRWLDRILRASGSLTNCSGSDLRYYRYPGVSAPVAHRRQVRLTRGTTVTRKRAVDCSVTWLATFTLTCDDPYEYGEPIPLLAGLGATTYPTGEVEHAGSLDLIQQSCPVYDYTPIYDPLFPALIPSPVAPNFYPEGWNIKSDMTFTRYWARVTAPEPHALNMVPLLTLTTDTPARRARVSLWPSTSAISDQCEPLFSVVVTYLPDGGEFSVDGEQSASYFWDGSAPVVRRTDSLVYSPDAKPVQWAAFNDPDTLLVTLDIFYEGAVVEGDGDVRLALSLIPKSD